jgi:hypothetical protein
MFGRPFCDALTTRVGQCCACGGRWCVSAWRRLAHGRRRGRGNCNGRSPQSAGATDCGARPMASITRLLPKLSSRARASARTVWRLRRKASKHDAKKPNKNKEGASNLQTVCNCKTRPITPLPPLSISKIQNGSRGCRDGPSAQQDLYPWFMRSRRLFEALPPFPLHRRVPIRRAEACDLSAALPRRLSSLL